MKSEELLSFPCHITVKAMGHGDQDLHRTVMAILNEHMARVEEDTLKITPSRTGKYVSVSIRVWAEERAQMDRVYQALTDHEHVLMAL